MTDRLSCDHCDEGLAELREIKRWHKDDTICAACFALTREAAEYDFTDFELAQGAMTDRPNYPAITAVIQDAARKMLALHDGFIDGRNVDISAANSLALASAFGAQAFAVCSHRDAAPSAMTRAFLLALIDPMHPSLDYLRAGNIVRFVAENGVTK